MYEPEQQPAAFGPEHEESVEQRLVRKTVLLAARLIQLLDEILPEKSGLREHRAALTELCRGVLGEEPIEVLRAQRNGSAEARARASSHPIDRIAHGLSLSAFELDLLLLAGLAEEHEAFAALLRGFHPRSEPRPTAALAARLLCRSLDERAFLREALEVGPLATSGAIQLGTDAPFYERSLLLGEGLWSALHGSNVWPVGITPRSLRPALSGLAGWLATRSAILAAEALRRVEPRTVLISAEDEETALCRGVALASAAGVPVAVLGWDVKNRELGRLASLHCLVRGELPVLKSVPREAGEQSPVLADHPRPILLCVRNGSAGPQGSRPVVTVPVVALSARERQSTWAAALPELERDAPLLAVRYPVEPATALEIAGDVRNLSALSAEPPSLSEVAECVRARSALSVSSNLILVRPKAGFADLVLRDSRLAQLKEAIARLRQQTKVFEDWGFLGGRPGARGVRMLLSGPPGTGKTLSAEVLARELGVDLLIIDLSRVVSKWLGETEKNLSDVFDAAERSRAVLLFDEADALFGNRTSVSDAHDRYANLETAYLLSRLERFEGLAILATNLRQNVDPAFLRRIEFVLDFEEPSAMDRERLWRCHLPKSAPLAADVDLRELATLYPIVGGLIKNAAVAAAFLAAGEGGLIERRHLFRAVWREYEKTGRAFPGLPAGSESSVVMLS